MSKSFEELRAASDSIQVYGESVTGMEVQKEGKKHVFVKATGFRAGEYVQKAGTDMLLLLPDTGKTLNHEEFGFESGTGIWNVAADDETVVMNMMQMSFDSVFDLSRIERGISGGISFGTPHIVGGKLCVQVTAWIRIDIDKWFIHIHERKDISQQVCISASTNWMNLFGFSFAGVECQLQGQYNPPNTHDPFHISFGEFCIRVHWSLPAGLGSGNLPNDNGQCMLIGRELSLCQDSPPTCSCSKAT